MRRRGREQFFWQIDSDGSRETNLVDGENIRQFSFLKNNVHGNASKCYAHCVHIPSVRFMKYKRIYFKSAFQFIALIKQSKDSGLLQKDRGSGISSRGREGSWGGDVRGRHDGSGERSGDWGSHSVVYHMLVVRERIRGNIGGREHSGGGDSEESEDGGKLWKRNVKLYPFLANKS